MSRPGLIRPGTFLRVNSGTGSHESKLGHKMTNAAAVATSITAKRRYQLLCMRDVRSGRGREALDYAFSLPGSLTIGSLDAPSFAVTVSAPRRDAMCERSTLILTLSAISRVT